MQLMRSTTFAAVTAGALLVSIAGCGSSGSPTATQTPSAAPSSAAPTTTATGKNPPSKNPPSKNPLADPPSYDKIATALAALSPGNGASVVGVPGGGYDGMVTGIDGDAGQLSFWRYDTSWHKVGTSTYPFDPSITTHPLAKPAPAALLLGMKHPVFVLTGTFSSDGFGPNREQGKKGTANAVAYTDGPDGWGVLTETTDGILASSGKGAGYGGPGLLYDASFVDGFLQTETEPNPQQPALAKLWSWDGAKLIVRTQFTR